MSLSLVEETQKAIAYDFKPIHNYVLLRKIDDAGVMKQGMIHLPQGILQKAPTFAEVIAIGDGHRMNDGTLVPFRVKPGDKVLFTELAGAEIRLDASSKPFYISREEEILGIVTEKGSALVQ